MKLYMISSSHLDTSWEWTLETTVEKFLPRTFSENFALIDKYPRFKFNWEGAFRYELLEEYYPELFKKLKRYVKKGRWAPVGASYENGDVNQPSPEAIFRNILYGQTFFREKLGAVSNDVFLPDCFGFGWALPAVAHHAGLKGFISQKLSFGSAYGYPFDLGLWYGSDGSRVLASIKPGVYSLHVEKLGDLRRDKFDLGKLKEIKKYGVDFTNRFFGVGDKGMGVAPETAAFVEEEIKKNPGSDIQIECVTSTEFFEIFDSLDEETKRRLPSWNTELPLSSHGVGGFTSRAAGSRWNKAAERLADACERACVFAAADGAEYPQKTIDSAWKRVIAHQFHDDITGTSLMKCYMRNWNDYLMSLSQFSEEYRRAVGVISSGVDTGFVGEGDIPVAVFDPHVRGCAAKRTVAVELDGETDGATVYGADGKPVPAQVRSEGGRSIVTFTADMPSLGAKAYGVRPGAAGPAGVTGVKADESSLENEFLRAVLDRNGDICSIIDKQSGRETLRAPIRHALFDYDGNRDYPAWELTYGEMMREPAAYAKAESVKVLESGPARASIKVTKRVRRSTVTEIITLDAGARTLGFECETDWRDEKALLKVVFDGSAACDRATYDLGLGVIERANNTPKVFECAAITWADITDRSGDHGFSIFSDSRTGWDKPNDSTLRLTVVHTPKYTRLGGQAHNLLDLGLLRYGFAVYPHEGGWRNGTQREADLYNHPACAAFVSCHAGAPERSFAAIKGDAIVRCLKKEHRGEKIVLRVNEPNGLRQSGVKFTLEHGIASAHEADAVEEKTGEATVKDGALVFDLAPFEVKTFVLTPSVAPERKRRAERRISLPCNIRAITERGEAGDLEFNIPAELIGKTAVSGGVAFKIARGEKNAIACAGQTVRMPKGRAHLLCASAGKEKTVALNGAKLRVPSMTEPYGSWDMIGLAHTGKVDPSNVLAFNATHAHDRGGNVVVLRDLAFYKLSFDHKGGTVTLPDDPDVIILAATVETGGDGADARFARDPFDRLEKRECDYTISYGAFKMIRRDRRPAKGNSHRDPAGGLRVDVRDLMLDNEVYDRGRDGLWD
ncbi:MAG: hypothetical protein IJR90_09515 [Clostridia bacterium]|nr:hypothetical protein [Clostridia bacterium]